MKREFIDRLASEA